jgi:hypothetical protein
VTAVSSEGQAEHVAHVIDEDGVEPVLFRGDGRTWTNASEITLRPGAVLDFGGGVTLENTQVLGFTYELHLEP